MKKLKDRLKRKICDVLSVAALWCEGRGCFKVSANYQTPLCDSYFVEVTNLTSGVVFQYRVLLKKMGEGCLINVILRYDIFRKDVPFQKAYTIEDINVLSIIDNIPSLKKVLNELHEATRKKD